MAHSGNGPGRGPELLFDSLRRRRGSKGRIVPVLLGVLAIALVGGGVWWYRSHAAHRAGAAAPAVAASTDSSGSVAPAAPARPSTVALPALDSSDTFVRHLAQGLSSRPRVAKWLASRDLVRRFVVAVAEVANGGSPAARLGFLAPKGTFEVRKSEERIQVDPASYRRYDAVTNAFVSLDTDGLAKLYHDVQPLCDQAYTELGLHGTFEDALARAFGRLLAVRVPETPPELVSHGATWAYANPRLQGLSAAAKHLLRMGPANARRVQAKLEALATAMGVQPRAPGGGETK